MFNIKGPTMSDGDQKSQVASPLLDRIGADRVFDVYRTHDGQFEIIEGCDGYFSITLTADEMRHLGQELIAAANVSQ